MNYTTKHVQGSVREQTFTKTVTLSNAPQMKSNSHSYNFVPMILELDYRDHSAPAGYAQTDAKVSGPVVLNDGTLSQTWTSRRFLGELGISSGPRWLREMTEIFRPNMDGVATHALSGAPESWAA